MARVLVAEDDAHILRVLAIWLKRNGHDVTETHTGFEAREKLLDPESRGFDIIVSDVNMPELSGVELARWIREERHWDIPIIILSSSCDQSALSQELEPLGVRVYPKPFSPSRLTVEIEQKLAVPTGARETWGHGDGGTREHVKARPRAED